IERQIMAAQEAKYSVMLKEQNFELRVYEPHIVAETAVEGGFFSAGNKAFGRLFKYIAGNNTARQSMRMSSPVAQGAASQKIAMTSPVGQQQVDGNWVVSFVMPADSVLETLPEPNDPKIVLRQIPAQHMAVIRYSGLWRAKSYKANCAALQAWIQKQGFTAIGEPIWARYNPPFTPWFLRRNEVLIPIATESL
ncbi:MAG TPA: heme-binding protein, partial [Thiopseudomonas sp.]|nr:heme-binding protein [Thiopseudomonas sp.]